MINNINKLMIGFGVVIDDAFKEDSDNKDDIFEIIQQIEDKDIPIVKYDDIPMNSIKHFRNASFILLDWNLTGITYDASEPIETPAELKVENIKNNIEFIESLKDICFVPLFIFTNENTENIINELVKSELYDKDKFNFIFVKNKSEIKNTENLFSNIEKWLKETTSIYVMKEWDLILSKAKNDLFWNFYNLNPDWPKVLWKAYKSDGTDMASELGQLITRNLKSRISHFDFDKNILEKNIKHIYKEDLINVMAGERLILEENLSKKEINTGDLFKIIENEHAKYFLNIRPQCDLIPRDDINLDSIKLYLLEGKQIDYPTSNSQLKNIFNVNGGNFKEQISEAILFPIEHSIIKFSFKNQLIRTFRNLKSKRIGKILSPYITRIQQRYALYLQREGLPITPKEAIFNNSR